jgi:hypothetical protein
MSLGPFSGWGSQNCSTVHTGLRAIPHDVQRVERRKKKRLPLQCSCEETQNTERELKYFWEGVWGSFTHGFLLFVELMEPQICVKRRMAVFEINTLKMTS